MIEALKHRILLFGDDASGRETAAFNLRGAGYQVDVAPNGEAGLNIFLADTHDLVVMDIRMPGITGLGVLRAIKTRAPDVPVLVITAFGAVTGEAMRAGYGCVVKPYELDHLLLTVERALENRALRDEVRSLRRKSKRVERPIVAESDAMRGVIEAADRVSLIWLPVRHGVPEQRSMMAGILIFLSAMAIPALILGGLLLRLGLDSLHPFALVLALVFLVPGLLLSTVVAFGILWLRPVSIYIADDGLLIGGWHVGSHRLGGRFIAWERLIGVASEWARTPWWLQEAEHCDLLLRISNGETVRVMASHAKTTGRLAAQLQAAHARFQERASKIPPRMAAVASLRPMKDLGTDKLLPASNNPYRDFGWDVEDVLRVIEEPACGVLLRTRAARAIEGRVDHAVRVRIRAVVKTTLSPNLRAVLERSCGSDGAIRGDSDKTCGELEDRGDGESSTAQSGNGQSETSTATVDPR